MFRYFVSCVAAMSMLAPLIARAQLTPGTTGSVRGVFGGRPVAADRVTHQSTLTFDLLGGYDDNLFGDVEPESSAGSVQPRGFGGTASGSLRYRVGRSQTFVQTGGSAFVGRQAGQRGRLVGGDVQVSAATPVTRRIHLLGDVRAAYEPAYLFNVFPQPVDQDAFTPGSSPNQGQQRQRWLAANTSAALSGDWSVRQRTNVAYNRSLRRPLNSAGNDSNSQGAFASHIWNPRPSAGFDVSYSYNDNVQVNPSLLQRPVRFHTGAVGVQLTRRLSPARVFTLSARGGATRSTVQAAADAQRRNFWSPTGSATTRLRLTRAWDIGADANRTVTVLEGLTPEPFVNNSVAISTAVRLGPRATVSLSGASARGEALVTRAGSFDSTAASAHFQYAPWAYFAFVTSYDYYSYSLRDVDSIVPGFPATYNRHAVRVGLTLWLPLYGRF